MSKASPIPPLIFALSIGLFVLFGTVKLALQFWSHLKHKDSYSQVKHDEDIGIKELNKSLAAGENLYMSCAACHGEKGQGNKTLNSPALNVQEDWYLIKQLKNFRNGIRGSDPTDLPGTQMRSMALILKSDKSIKDVASYISTFREEKLTLPNKTIAGDIKRGQNLYSTCIACHGDQGQGNKNLNAPSLAGQHDWYNVLQLKNFKSGIRGNDARDPIGMMMRPMAMTLPTDQEINDVVAHIATFVPAEKNQSGEMETTQPLASSESSTPDPEKGRTIFIHNCAACHQENGEGQIGLAPSIRNRDFLAIATDDFIKRTIIQGRPGTAMISRADLSNGDINHIIAFLRSLKIANPVNIPVDRTKKIRGNASAGRNKYATYCAACHGVSGEGYSAGGSGPGIGLPGFLDLVSDDYIFQTVKHGRVGTPMLSFIGAKGVANLNESDVNDIIAHLRIARQQLSGEPPVKPTNELASADEIIHAGEKKFQTNCAACHQSNGEGKIGLAPSIRNRDFLAIASDDFIKKTIKQGRLGTSMIARPDLSETDLDQIIAYLRSLKIANPISISVSSELKIAGDVHVGKDRFAQYCASCHGPKGEGYSAGGSGPGIGLSGFLNVASDDFIYKTVKYGRVGTAMKSFIGAKGVANLSKNEVFNIIAYLRSLN